MSTLIDERGNKYNFLTVVDRYPKKNSKHAFWLCICDCGKEVIVRGADLRIGVPKSCGCKTAKDLRGMRYGRLVVIDREGSTKSRKATWRCICDCGKETIVTSSNLTSGNTKSCGCLMPEVSADYHRKPKGYSGLTVVYGKYKWAAKARNLDFKLTRDDFLSIVLQDCHYCGSQPDKEISVERLNGIFKYNGIDRIDNDKGYTLDNVVPCCKICNRAKSSMNYDDFIKWIRKISERNHV